jgi:hypothetical protein
MEFEPKHMSYNLDLNLDELVPAKKKPNHQLPNEPPNSESTREISLSGTNPKTLRVPS